MSYSKKRLQKLAGLIKESSYHFAKHDHLHKIIERHVSEMLRELDIEPEDQPIVFDDLFHHIKRYLSRIVSENTSPEAAQDLHAYFGKRKDKLKESVGPDSIAKQAEHLKSQFTTARGWNDVLMDLKDMMNGGGADGVRAQYYQGWADEDFAELLGLIGGGELVDVSGAPRPQRWPKDLEEQSEGDEELGFDLDKRMAEPDIPVEDVVDGVMVVNWGDILDMVMPNYWDDFQKHLDSKGKHGYPSYNDTTEAVGKWADEHNGLVWSWGGERWMSAAEMQQAVREAKKQGKTLVVMEYLS